jgi:agmatinase
VSSSQSLYGGVFLTVASYDNTFALHQIEEGHFSILSRTPKTDAKKKGPAKNGKTLPRVITLGGDHTITLPLLKSINRAYGPVSVIHFDSHLDTCKWQATAEDATDMT